MSCEEDFSFVMESPLEGILKDIAKFKVQYDQLLLEQNDLTSARDDQNDIAEQFRDRAVKLKKSLEDDKSNQAREVDHEKWRLASLHEEESRLKRDIERMKEELCRLDESNHSLKQQTDVTTAVPEKRVVFTGVTGGAANSLDFDIIPRIVYPMEGGTALITFEDEIVAQKILSMGEHNVELGDCSITLEAKPVQLMVPSHVEMDTKVCPRRILVSNLPKNKIEEDSRLDKLDIHFSRKRNGGGDVEETDMLHDSDNVVITFTESDVAKGLTDKQYHDVQFDKGKKHKVKVTPFLSGEITNFNTCISICGRTVLLTGIPAIIMEQETLQDLLEIHFQKASNGGGEVDAIIYNPLGHNFLALFEDDCPNESSSK